MAKQEDPADKRVSTLTLFAGSTYRVSPSWIAPELPGII